MVLSMPVILILCALIAFLLDAFRVPAGISWFPLGWAFVMAAILFGLHY